MKTQLQHVQINVSDREAGLAFYRDLFAYFEFDAIEAGEDLVGFSDGSLIFWLMVAAPEHRDRGFHRKAPGLNHVAFRVSGRDDVDRFAAEFLTSRGIVPMSESPKEIPEYGGGYYAVYFEDPDRIKLEVMCNV
nr:K423 [uncultured bacterium]